MKRLTTEQLVGLHSQLIATSGGIEGGGLVNTNTRYLLELKDCGQKSSPLRKS